MDSIPVGPGRAPFGSEAADVLSEFKPAVVSFHFGLPSAGIAGAGESLGLERFSRRRRPLKRRVWLEAHGVDAIIAQGLEAGGHRGIFLSDDLSTQVGTIALLPQIVQRSEASGHCCWRHRGCKGVAAALALGAAGVQIGTAYLLCPEATTERDASRRAESEAARHTALTNSFTGRPARGIVNRIMKELGPISTAPPAFPLATAAIAPLRAKAESRGSGDFSPLWSGQNASGCKEIPAAQLTRELATDIARRPARRWLVWFVWQAQFEAVPPSPVVSLASTN